jgi:hypothetical protein
MEIGISPQTLPTDYVEEFSEFIMERFIMTTVVLSIYGPFSFVVMCRYWRQIDRSAFVTICIYLFCIIITFWYSIYQIFT